MRQTSLIAYQHLKDNELLSKARWKVYDLLFRHGPCTSGELFQKDPRSVVKGSICARMTELEAAGVVKSVGEKECQLTGMTATVWDVTDLDTPRPIPRNVKETSKQREARLIAEKEELQKRLERAQRTIKNLQDLIEELEKETAIPGRL